MNRVARAVRQIRGAVACLGILVGCDAREPESRGREEPLGGVNTDSWQLREGGKVDVASNGFRCIVSIQESEAGHVVCRLDEGPPFVHALSQAPRQREPMLNKGSWLVLVFAPASVADMDSVASALAVVCQRSGAVELGLRPFLAYDETKSWYGDFGSPESPLWIAIKEGKVLTTRKGVLKKEQMNELLGVLLDERPDG